MVVVGRDQDARGAVHDRVELTADGGGDDRRGTGHGLQGNDAEGLVPGQRQHQVGAGHQPGHPGPADPAEEGHPVRDAVLARDAVQACGLGLGAEQVGLGAAGDEEFGVGDAGQGADGAVEALAGHEPADGQQPSAGAGRAGAGDGGELVGVDPAGHDADPVLRQPHGLQFGHLVAARGDDPGALVADGLLDGEALRRAGVGGALVALLHRAQRVVGLHDRDAEGAGAGQGGQARHPEVGVHHVGRALGPLPGQEVPELGHVGQEFVLGDGCGRSGGHVHHLDAVDEGDPVREARGVPPGVHRDPVSLPGELPGDLRHVHVLAARVRPAERGQGAGVLGDHGDAPGRVRNAAHRVTSLIRRSQSSRKRRSP